MVQGHLATWFRIHSVYKQINPTFLPKLGTLLCSLAIYKPTPLPAIPTPLCILNLDSILANQLLVMANIVPRSILVTLMMEALSSSETSVFTRATQHNIPEDAILLRNYVFPDLHFTPWSLDRKRTIPTERPPLVDEI
jgi:hypothetical protein